MDRNLFDETPPRMKMSFSSYGHFNVEDGVDEHLIDLIPLSYVDKQVKGRPFTTDDNDFWKM